MRPGVRAPRQASRAARRRPRRAAAPRPVGRPRRRRDAGSTLRRRRRRSAGTRPARSPRSGPRRSRPGTRRRRRSWRRPRARAIRTRRRARAVRRPATFATQPSGSVTIASRAPSSQQLADRDDAILLVVELVADELLGLQHVRRDDVRLGAHREAHRLALGVDDGRHAQSTQLADQLRVDRRVDARGAATRRTRRCRRRGPGTAACRGTARTSLGRHLGPALVDLGLRAGRRIVHRGVRARLLADPHEVAEDRLLRQLPRRCACRSRRPRSRWRSRAGRAFLSVRATLTPLPPGIVRCSTVRWRRPSRKFGTDNDLSIAALRVTVMITRSCSSRRARSDPGDGRAPGSG